MRPKPFDYFMIATELGSNPKIARLDDRQFRCLILGAWALAAKSTPRGYLTVAGEPATAQDVAHQAHCTFNVARSTLTALRKMEMLEMDEALGLEFCHDWWSINPDPRNDPSNAERQARYRARNRNGSNTGSNGTVTQESPLPEVEGEVEVELKLASPLKVVGS